MTQAGRGEKRRTAGLPAAYHSAAAVAEPVVVVFAVPNVFSLVDVSGTCGTVLAATAAVMLVADVVVMEKVAEVLGQVLAIAAVLLAS